MSDPDQALQNTEGDGLPSSPSQGLSTISVQELTNRIEKIRTARKKVMEEDVHYGTIPGTGDKPTLLKPGAEMLCSLFQLAPDPELTIKELEGDHREYIIQGGLRHIPSDRQVGSGYGSCSTKESKYRYRYLDEVTEVDVPGEFWDSYGDDESMAEADFSILEKLLHAEGVDIPDGGDVGVTKNDDGEWKLTVSAQGENPDLADVYNTCLKMAKKRWLVDVSLTATAASELFTQDVEDLQDLKGADVGSSSGKSTNGSGKKNGGQRSGGTQGNGRTPRSSPGQSEAGSMPELVDVVNNLVPNSHRSTAMQKGKNMDQPTRKKYINAITEADSEQEVVRIVTGEDSGKAQREPQNDAEAKASATDDENNKRRYDDLQDAISRLMPSAIEAGQGPPPPEKARISSEKEHEDDTTQLGRLMWLADKNGWKDAWLDRLIKDELGFESKKHIPWEDAYDEICEALEDQELKYWVSRDTDTKDMFEGKDDEGNKAPIYQLDAFPSDFPYASYLQDAGLEKPLDVEMYIEASNTLTEIDGIGKSRAQDVRAHLDMLREGGGRGPVTDETVEGSPYDEDAFEDDGDELPF